MTGIRAKHAGTHVTDQRMRLSHSSSSFFSCGSFVTNSLRLQSVSSDQVSPLFFLHCYILRGKLDRMKRIKIEISVRYDSWRFSNCATIRYNSQPVSSDQDSPLYCLYICMRVKSGRMKRVGTVTKAVKIVAQAHAQHARALSSCHRCAWIIHLSKLVQQLLVSMPAVTDSWRHCKP